MTGHEQDAPELRRAVRTALLAAEPSQAPAFAPMWRRAASPRPTHARAWRLASAAAALTAVVATAVWLALPDHDAPADADYLLAAQVVADHDRGNPTDSWLDQAPTAPLSGGPALPSIEYPLLPKETFL